MTAGPHVCEALLAAPAHDHHLVQFYEDDGFLSDAVGRFLGAGLLAGEPVVVIATASHRRLFTDRLRAAGHDVDGAIDRDQLRLLDARETLSRFVVRGVPDAALFSESFGAVLAEAGGGRRVRAYGEMVDLLCQDGRVEAAIRVEELWNQLAARRSFCLLCAYPMASFSRCADASPFERVCRAHTHVIPAEGYASVEDPEQRHAAIAQLQQRARALDEEVRTRKRVERALVEAIGARDVFLASASHELKTPLTALLLHIQGLAELSARAGGDPRTHDRLGKAVHQAKRLDALIEQLLDAARIEAGRLTLATEPCDLAELVRETVDRMAGPVSQSGCHLRILAEQGVTGSWDPRRVDQVVTHLCANALRYARGRPVEILIRKQHGRAQLVVRDHGEGLRPEDQARVFDRFERVSTRQAGGLGLGLWIVKQLVEAHGGTIRVDSKPGEGAAFTVDLPRAEGD